MKFLNKNMMIVGAMTLTLTLFSFKPADSNETNMGETVVHQQSKSYDYAGNQEAVALVKVVAKKVVDGAKKVWDGSGKTAAQFVFQEAVTFILVADQPFDGIPGIKDYKMSKL